MNWYGYVYKTVNLLNGKVYIGRRKCPFDRSYHGSGIRVTRAIKFHGPHYFLTEVLSYATTFDELCAMEIQHIRAYRQRLPTDMLYNIADGGEGGFTGCNPSKETRQVWSEQRRGENNGMHGVHLNGELNPRWGVKLTDETKRKIGEANRRRSGSDHGNYGKVRSPETREKISRSKRGVPNLKLRGRVFSDEHRRKLSDAMKRMVPS